MSAAVRVRTPCRLHFGMFSFGRDDRPEFGGVGAMVEPPNVEVSFCASSTFEVHGAKAARVTQFVETIARSWRLSSIPKCRIEVLSPADHTGLGVGTQLGLATAAGLRRFLRLPPIPIEELALSAGRGKRSAIGSYGFEHGGLIVDAGKARGEAFGRLSRQLPIPSAWRFVLVRLTDGHGLEGEQEATTFAKLPAVLESVTGRLEEIVNDRMLPSVEAEDCDRFGEAVYEFGHLAGECFAAAQGGSFANSDIERLVQVIREFGVPGVGQSSWGPTVFALLSDSTAANRLTNWIESHDEIEDCEITIARPNNTGALVEG